MIVFQQMNNSKHRSSRQSIHKNMTNGNHNVGSSKYSSSSTANHHHSHNHPRSTFTTSSPAHLNRTTSAATAPNMTYSSSYHNHNNPSVDLAFSPSSLSTASSSSLPQPQHTHQQHQVPLSYHHHNHHHMGSITTTQTTAATATNTPIIGIDHHSSPYSMRGRRGRQARPSQLTSSMHKAVRKFSRVVGAPNVVPPAGFRDFRGWLIKLNSKECRSVWDQLIATIARDVSCQMDIIHSLKEDIVREIVKCVVIPRPDESAKLVSTNAGRQASRPRSGTTLMIVLDQQLQRVEPKLPQLVTELYPSRSSSSELRNHHHHHHHVNSASLSSPHLSSSNSFLNQNQNQNQSNYYYHQQQYHYQHPSTSVSWNQRQRSSNHHNNSYQQQQYSTTSSRLPSVQDLLVEDRGTPRALPSFRELDASLRRTRTSGGR